MTRRSVAPRPDARTQDLRVRRVIRDGAPGT